MGLSGGDHQSGQLRGFHNSLREGGGEACSKTLLGDRAKNWLSGVASVSGFYYQRMLKWCDWANVHEVIGLARKKRL